MQAALSTARNLSSFFKATKLENRADIRNTKGAAASTFFSSFTHLFLFQSFSLPGHKAGGLTQTEGAAVQHQPRETAQGLLRSTQRRQDLRLAPGAN